MSMIATLQKERAKERERKARTLLAKAPKVVSLAKAPKVVRANHGMTGVTGVMSPKATVENHLESQREKKRKGARENGKGRGKARGKARLALGINKALGTVPFRSNLPTT